MDLVIDGLSWIFLVSGAFFMLVSGVGVLRMPDVFTRAHAAGVKDTMGAALTLLGLILQAGLTLVTVKLIFIWLFLWFTSPVASHSVARAAVLGGIRPILGRNGASGSDGEAGTAPGAPEATAP
ncbi:MAG: monovalent cation/H(+) antiporter subunit G [Gemmatimonadota bacterium]